MTLPQQQSATVFLQALLKQWGLESLSGTVADMLTAGDSADVIPIKLRETEPYKKRFRANLDRIKNGLPAYSEAEFLATEAALRGVVRRYVGAGTMDTRDNLDRWISSDVSAQELNERMARYQEDWLSKKDIPVQLGDGSWTTVGDAWAAHGLTPADGIRAVGDSTVTQATLERQTRTFALGAEALRAYRDANVLDPARLGQLAGAGVDADEARRGFGEVAAREDYEGFLARSAGTTLTRQEQEDEALLEDQAAVRKRKKVLDTDQARFAENYLQGPTSLGRVDRGSY